MKPRIYFAPSGVTMYPTGTCFDDSLDNLEKCMKLMYPPGEIYLVHALCLNPIDSTRFAHAWLEMMDKYAMQDNIAEGKHYTFVFKLGPFRDALRIQKETRYSVPHAIAMNYQTCNYGPWEPEYIELCKARKNSESKNVISRP